MLYWPLCTRMMVFAPPFFILHCSTGRLWLARCYRFLFFSVLFIQSTVVSFVVLVARGRRSAVDIDLDDLEDSDDERLIRGWTARVAVESLFDALPMSLLGLPSSCPALLTTWRFLLKPVSSCGSIFLLSKPSTNTKTVGSIWPTFGNCISNSDTFMF